MKVYEKERGEKKGKVVLRGRWHGRLWCLREALWEREVGDDLEDLCDNDDERPYEDDEGRGTDEIDQPGGLEEVYLGMFRDAVVAFFQIEGTDEQHDPGDEKRKNASDEQGVE